MRTLIVFALLIAAASAFRGYTHGHNGQPACTDPAEKTNLPSVWRNNFDPTRYWECTEADKPAQARACKSEFMFQPVKNKCVWREDWVWTPLEDPWSMYPPTY